MAIEFVHLHAKIEDGLVVLTQQSDGGPANVISCSVEQFEWLCESLRDAIQRHFDLKNEDAGSV